MRLLSPKKREFTHTTKPYDPTRTNDYVLRSCKMLSLGTKVYNSTKLLNSGLSGTLQHDLIERADGFAEVFPEHKYKVVEMLQQRGSLTAMTGDGRFHDEHTLTRLCPPSRPMHQLTRFIRS